MGCLFDILFGMYNHEMYIQWLGTNLCHCLNDRKSERDIGNKHSVHYVEVKPVGFALIDHLYVALQVDEVG